MDWKTEFVENMLGAYIDIDRIDYSLDLKFRNIPRKLYKYREFDSNDSSIKNLVGNTVWMNSPENFNDPYDCALTFNPHRISSPENSIRSFCESLGIPLGLMDRKMPNFLEQVNPAVSAVQYFAKHGIIEQDLADQVAAELIRLTDEQIETFSNKVKKLSKVCAFSESNASVLMWAHYARYHTGFCIEYDFTLLGKESLTTKLLYPVLYSESLHDHTEHMAGIDITRANPLSIVLPVITKAPDWAYEKEWRLVYSNNFMAGPQSHAVPKPIKVYAGSKIKPADLDKLQFICSNLEIPLVRMTLSPTSFEIIPAVS